MESPHIIQSSSDSSNGLDIFDWLCGEPLGVPARWNLIGKLENPTRFPSMDNSFGVVSLDLRDEFLSSSLAWLRAMLRVVRLVAVLVAISCLLAFLKGLFLWLVARGRAWDWSCVLLDCLIGSESTEPAPNVRELHEFSLMGFVRSLSMS